MRELLDGMLPGLPNGTVGPIVDRAGGVPLYAVEMVRALLADGRIERRGDAFVPTGDLGSLPIPIGLRSLIASRLDALPIEDRALLQQAAVLGLVFGIDALASVSGTDAVRLESRMRELVRRELLEMEADPRSPERGQYRFVHSFIREVAYDTLAMRERRGRHLAAARYLEASESDEAAGALATHYLAAFRASDEDPDADAVRTQATVSLRTAADRAARLGAHEQAVGNLEHALELAVDPRERAELLERAAASANAAGLPSDLAFAEQALAIYGDIRDRSAATATTALIGDLLLDAGRVPEASELLLAALAGLDGDTEGTSGESEAALLSVLSRTEMRLEHNTAAVALADRALVIAKRDNLVRVEASALVNKGTALTPLGRPREAAPLLEAGIRLAQREGLAHLEIRARLNLGNTYLDDEPVRALEVYQQNVRLAERIGDRLFYFGNIFYHADPAILLATAETWRAADELVRKAIDLGATGIDLLELTSYRLFIEISRGAGIGDGIADLDRLAAASSDPRARSVPFMARAWQACLEQRWSDAADSALTAIDLDTWTTLQMVGDVARAALLTGEVGQLVLARRAADEITLNGATSTGVRTATDAALNAIRGMPEEAYAQFAAAFELYRSAGVLWNAAVMTIDANIALPGDPRVLAWEPQARATFKAVGATAWTALLASVTGTGDSTAPTASVEESAPTTA